MCFENYFICVIIKFRGIVSSQKYNRIKTLNYIELCVSDIWYLYKHWIGPWIKSLMSSVFMEQHQDISNTKSLIMSSTQIMDWKVHDLVLSASTLLRSFWDFVFMFALSLNIAILFNILSFSGWTWTTVAKSQSNPWSLRKRQDSQEW